MTPTDLDTLIAQLKSPNGSIAEMDHNVLAAGLEDLRNRMSHVEHSNLKVLANLRANDERLVGLENDSRGFKADRDEFRKKVDTATTLPAENQKKIAELETRVHTCEGAVGAAPYKEPKKIEPAKDTPAPAEQPKPAGWHPFASTTPPVQTPGPDATPVHA